MTVYEAAGGSAGIQALAHAWHKRCLADPLVSHPFSHPGQHPQHLERLAAYWGEALGGPPTYSGTMGTEASVLRMHAGSGKYAELNRAAIACFDAALADVGITNEPLRSVLHDYFAWSAQRMGDHPNTPGSVPDDASLPHWSWDGLQSS